MLDKQCASCPFREDNDKEFGEVVKRLDPTLNPTQVVVSTFGARHQIREESKVRGDFSCHHTAYDKDMKIVDYKLHRQCPGAAKVYIDEGERLTKTELEGVSDSSR